MQKVITFGSRGAVAHPVERPKGSSLVQLYLHGFESRQRPSFLYHAAAQELGKILAVESAAGDISKINVQEEEKNIHLEADLKLCCSFSG